MGTTLIIHRSPVQLKGLRSLFLRLVSSGEAAAAVGNSELLWSNCRQRQVADLAMIQAGAMITFWPVMTLGRRLEKASWTPSRRGFSCGAGGSALVAAEIPGRRTHVVKQGLLKSVQALFDLFMIHGEQV